MKVDVAIIGGGPAGLAAAIGARSAGIENVLIIERDAHLGGILNQCIHNGFGLHTFKKELTGPEYAAHFKDQVKEMGIPTLLSTMVLDITPDKKITAVNSTGIIEIDAKAIILAMGCRERPRGAINIPGSRPTGVYTAGTAQKFVNLDGYVPGKRLVMLGSGDIGLIMARRMVFEGAKVEAVVEIMPYSSGLKRNIVQCLDDFGIPLKLSHTITEIHGKRRLEGVTVSKVDDERKPIAGTEEYIPCDILLLSVGLVPENELSKSAGVVISEITNGPFVNESFQTNVDGIFACGNVLHVHDLVDNVSAESRIAGTVAADYVRGKSVSGGEKKVVVDVKGGIRYTVPTTIDPRNMLDKVDIRFRVSDVFRDRHIAVYFDDKVEQRYEKRTLAPGEMETVVINREVFEKYPEAKKITIAIEG